MKASEMFKKSPWIKAIIYGDSGSGKTTWAAKSPRPFYILTEPQGLPSVAKAAPEAELYPCTSYQAFVKVMNAVRSCEKIDGGIRIKVERDKGVEAFDVSTIVIDSLTDLHDRMTQFFNVGTDDTGWFKVSNELREVMQALRSAPVNVVCLCLSTSKDDDKGVRKVMPDLFGKASAKIGQYFSAIGYAHKMKQGEARAYAISWDIPSASYITKRLPGSDHLPSTTLSPVGRRGATLGAIVSAWLGPDAAAKEEGDEDEAKFLLDTEEGNIGFDEPAKAKTRKPK